MPTVSFKKVKCLLGAGAVLALALSLPPSAAGAYVDKPPPGEPPMCFDLPECQTYEFPDLQYSHTCTETKYGYPQTRYVYIHQVTGAWCLYGPVQP